jgi:hypothetical protein
MGERVRKQGRSLHALWRRLWSFLPQQPGEDTHFGYSVLVLLAQLVTVEFLHNSTTGKGLYSIQQIVRFYKELRRLTEKK